MRTGSGDRKIRAYDTPGGFRSDSKRKSSTDSKRFRSRESGMGWDGIGGEDLQPLTERRAREFAWVCQHLPDEHEGMAVSALLSIQTFGEKPTRDSVLARLRAQGRTADQLREKGWL